MVAKKITATLPGELGSTAHTLLSNDGKRLAFGDPLTSDNVRIWDMATNRAITLATGIGNNSPPLHHAAGFSPDGSLIAVHGNYEGTAALLVFEIDTGLLVGKALNQPKTSAWSPDGRWIASLGRPLTYPEIQSDAVGHSAGAQGNVLLLSEVVHPVTGLRTREQVERMEFSQNGSQFSVNRTLYMTHKDERRCSLIPVAEEGGGLVRFFLNRTAGPGISRPDSSCINR